MLRHARRAAALTAATLAVAAIGAAAAGTASASAYTATLTMTGLPHNPIQLDSWSWGVTHTVSVTGTGAAGGVGASSSGRSHFQSLNFTHQTDAASPKLFEMVTAGVHPKTTVLSVSYQPDSPSPVNLLTMTLTNALFASYSQTGGTGETAPEDSLSLNFTKIVYKTNTVAVNGFINQTVTDTFDSILNRNSDLSVGHYTPFQPG
jgi:type VI protein secretion system component Hcp